MSHRTFCLILCFVPIPSYLTFCPNSFLQLSTFFLLIWSSPYSSEEDLVNLLIAKFGPLLFFTPIHQLCNKKNVHILSQGVVWHLTTKYNLCSTFGKWTTYCICQGCRRIEKSVFFSVKINISTTGGFRVGFFQPDTNHP